MKTFFRTEIGTPFSNGGQHDTEESLREFMRALEADMVYSLFISHVLISFNCRVAVISAKQDRCVRSCGKP